jgi:hypothetical protein
MVRVCLLELIRVRPHRDGRLDAEQEVRRTGRDRIGGRPVVLTTHGRCMWLEHEQQCNDVKRYKASC